MAKLTPGLLAALSGKIAGFVVVRPKNRPPYLRAAPGKRTDTISEKEKDNRVKFKLAQDWLRPLTDFVRQGFKYEKQKDKPVEEWIVEGFVAAKSYLMKNAMGPDHSIDPALMKVSVGTLSLSEDIAVGSTADGALHFTWSTAAVKDGSSNDQVMLLAYDIKNEQALFTTAGEFRRSGSAVLPAPGNKGASCHVYLAFVAADRTRQSDSVYLGEIAF